MVRRMETFRTNGKMSEYDYNLMIVDFHRQMLQVREAALRDGEIINIA